MNPKLNSLLAYCFGLFLTSGLPVGAMTATTVTLDRGSRGTTGQYTSQAVVNGSPAVAYYNASEENLMFARNSAADGSGTWSVVTVDASSDDVGRYCSLAVVNGNPAISYYSSRDALKYVRANDASGTSWGTPVLVDRTFGRGEFCSLAVVNGNPAISYHDHSLGDLMYVRASDANGTSWGTPVGVDTQTVGGAGEYTSLLVVNGNPAISYYDTGGLDLRYVRANDANGMSWGTPVVVDSVGYVGSFASMAVVNGNPAISYYDESNGDIKYVRANDASGTSWSAGVIVEDSAYTGNVASSTSLVVINGNPAISYYDWTNGNLKYARANDASGTSWNTPLAVDSAGTVGEFSSMAVVNDFPAISYYDWTNHNLKYVRAGDANGSSWQASVVADNGFESGEVGRGTSQAIVNGCPAVCYYDQGNRKLKFVRASNASGSSWGAPIVIDPSGYGGEFCSLAIVNGNPAVSYFAGALMYVRASDPNGTGWGAPVSIAYTSNGGKYTSLVVINGNPAISYHDVTNADLKYVRAGDVSGTSWGTPVSIDTAGSVGQYTSTAVVNGVPAISYYDVTNGDLKFVRASDLVGASWGQPISIDTSGNVGQYTSLAVVNGNPAISYYDKTNGKLKFVRATDVVGSGWGVPVTIAVADAYTSLAVVNGNPAISYSYNQLQYVRAGDASGTIWGTPVAVDTANLVGRYSSMVVLDGNPAISYHDWVDENLKWATFVEPSNANLGGLTFSAGILSPAFAASTTSYMAEVPMMTTNLTVAATGVDVSATLQVRINGGSFTPITAGTASGALALVTGANTVDVKVTSSDGSVTKTYSTTVMRAALPDVKIPTVTVTAPAASSVILEASGPRLNITGFAADDHGLADVAVSIDGGAFTPATLTFAAGGKTGTFVMSVVLQPGDHKIAVRSTDTTGNLSAIVTRSVTYQVVRALSVNLNDDARGSVPSGFTPTSNREVGRSYTITATPKPGFVFSGWIANNFTGTGVTTLAAEVPTLTFVMQESLQLTASFVANPFTSSRTGTFNGLVLPAAIPSSFDTIGMIQNLKLLANGSFTGVLKIDGLSFPLSGSFHPTSGAARFGTGAGRTAELALIRSQKPSLVVKMALNMGDSSLAGTVIQRSHGAEFNLCGITAYRAAYGATARVPAALAGTVTQAYTLLFPSLSQLPSISPAYYPQSPGYATMTLTSTGTVSYTGRLADHTLFSGSTALTIGNLWPFFASLYAGKGALAGYAALFDSGPSAYDVFTASPLLWSRPVIASSQWYPDGWPDCLVVDCVGARYVVPPATPAKSVFPGLQATTPNIALSFSDGLLTSTLSFDQTVSTANVVTNVPVTFTTPTMTITKNTGLVTGSFPHTDGTKPAYQGVILQKGPLAGARGYFMSTSPKVKDGRGESGAMRVVVK